MKIQVRSILFALVVPVAACGGDRDTSTVDFQLSDYVVQPKLDAQPVTSSMQPTVRGGDIKLVDVTTPMPTKLGELVAEGKKLVTAGKYGDAKEMFDAALKLDKKNVDVHIELARMYISMNEKGLAVAAANKAIKLAPLSSQAWNTKGRAELTAHKYDEAVEAFTKAVELSEDNVFAWNNLGYTELLLKKYEDAAQHLAEATSRPGATGYMFNNLGTALEHLDKLDDARVAYESGGKLGSKEAASSRKRLEGVDTIVVDDVATVDAAGEVHDAVRAEAPAPKVKEYELTDEGDVDDATAPEDVTPEVSEGSGSSDEDGAKTETPVEPSDHATM